MKISVQPLLPTGNYLNVRLGVEAELPDHGTLEDWINTYWDSLIAIHMKRYPHLYNEKGEPLYEKAPQGDEMRGTHVRDVVKEPVQDIVLSTINAINDCKSLDELKDYWIMSKGNLTYSQAYKEKEKQLKG